MWNLETESQLFLYCRTFRNSVTVKKGSEERYMISWQRVHSVSHTFELICKE